MNVLQFSKMDLVIKKFIEDNKIEMLSDFDTLNNLDVVSSMLASAIIQELINPEASSATSTGIKPKRGRPRGSKNKKKKESFESNQFEQKKIS